MESLLLFRRAFSSPTMCRFIPALSVPHRLSVRPKLLRVSKSIFSTSSCHRLCPVWGLWRTWETGNIPETKWWGTSCLSTGFNGFLSTGFCQRVSVNGFLSTGFSRVLHLDWGRSQISCPRIPVRCLFPAKGGKQCRRFSEPKVSSPAAGSPARELGEKQDRRSFVARRNEHFRPHPNRETPAPVCPRNSCILDAADFQLVVKGKRPC
jgi:hypothetical protein